MKLKKLTIDIEVAQILADASNVEKGRQFSKLLRAMSCGEAREDDPAWVREAVGKALAANAAHRSAARKMNQKKWGAASYNDTPNESFNESSNDTFNDTKNDTLNESLNDTRNESTNDTGNDKTAKTPESLMRARSLLSEKHKNLSFSPLNSPPSSLPGMAEVGAAAEEASGATLRQMIQDRLTRLFRRRPTTRWNDAEKRALGEIAKRPGVEEELEEIERLYRSGYKYRRKDIKTLLNNWTTELDRAAGYFGLREPKRSFEEQLEDA